MRDHLIDVSVDIGLRAIRVFFTFIQGIKSSFISWRGNWELDQISSCWCRSWCRRRSPIAIWACALKVYAWGIFWSCLRAIVLCWEIYLALNSEYKTERSQGSHIVYLFVWKNAIGSQYCSIWKWLFQEWSTTNYKILEFTSIFGGAGTTAT